MDSIKSFFQVLGFALVCFLMIIMPLGCSQNDEQQAGEKGAIEKMTDQAAEAVVKKVQTPKDKARATSKLGEDRLEEMDKVLQKQ